MSTALWGSGPEHGSWNSRVIDRHIDRAMPELEWAALASSADVEDWVVNAFEPAPSQAECALIDDWRLHSDVSKPFSVEWFSGDEPDTWGGCDDWLPWLGSHPQAMDSLEILDDLITLLSGADRAMGEFENPWLQKLIDRGVAILMQHWPEDREGNLPWLITENRPALRILARAIVERDDEGRWDEATWRLTSAYSRLNPVDNHGFRELVINQLLIAGRDEEALVLANQYPDDSLAEIVYGRVLALFRGCRDGMVSRRHRRNGLGHGRARLGGGRPRLGCWIAPSDPLS